MPVDPSIIANSMSTMASKMPDVNALMQQRVQGAENIYKIETARQEEAAEAAKEQQAAIAQMMLPSVAAAFSDPSDAGLEAATSLMPPEAAETFAPFMDRLRGVPDPKLRQALLRAELMKDPEGRLILGQLEPTANMRLQADTAARRAALDERRLAFEEEKLAAEAAGGGKMAFRETDAEGNVRVYDAQGNEIRMLPRAGKPAPAAADTPDQKMQAKEGVDGTLSRIMDQYNILANEKAIVSAKNTAAQNIGARLSTQFGPTVGRSVGTKSQTARDTIANLRQALLADIKAATGMSSKAIDSNVELKSFLDSLGDPDQSIETIKNTLAELSIKYGAGSLGNIAEETTAAPTPAQSTAPPASAVEFLINNPQFSDQFDAKYGAGAAARILGE